MWVIISFVDFKAKQNSRLSRADGVILIAKRIWLIRTKDTTTAGIPVRPIDMDLLI